jgi:hypothetical protein
MGTGQSSNSHSPTTATSKGIFVQWDRAIAQDDDVLLNELLKVEQWTNAALTRADLLKRFTHETFPGPNYGDPIALDDAIAKRALKCCKALLKFVPNYEGPTDPFGSNAHLPGVYVSRLLSFDDYELFYVLFHDKGLSPNTQATEFMTLAIPAVSICISNGNTNSFRAFVDCGLNITDDVFSSLGLPPESKEKSEMVDYLLDKFPPELSTASPDRIPFEREMMKFAIRHGNEKLVEHLRTRGGIPYDEDEEKLAYYVMEEYCAV